jgi:16S rRNA (uracil1498-N3)-methyltransferase
MEFLVQKACELGVHAFYPLVSERCVVKLSRERWESKAARWRKIAMESCKQCGRATIPEIHAPQNFKTFVQKELKPYDLVLIPTLVKEGKGMYHILNSAKAQNALILIGPEGDFTRDEAALAITAGAIPVDLGPLVMRSETAAMAALTVTQFMLREAKHA